MLLAARSTSLVTWPQTPCSLERLHSACARNLRESAEVELRNGRAGRHSRIDSALTIPSSRDRFAASADHGNMLFCQGRKSVRLNSGVRLHMSQVASAIRVAAIFITLLVVACAGALLLLPPLSRWFHSSCYEPPWLSTWACTASWHTLMWWWLALAPCLIVLTALVNWRMSVRGGNAT